MKLFNRKNKYLHINFKNHIEITKLIFRYYKYEKFFIYEIKTYYTPQKSPTYLQFLEVLKIEFKEIKEYTIVSMDYPHKYLTDYLMNNLIDAMINNINKEEQYPLVANMKINLLNELRLK